MSHAGTVPQRWRRPATGCDATGQAPARTPQILHHAELAYYADLDDGLRAAAADGVPPAPLRPVFRPGLPARAAVSVLILRV